MIVVYDFSTVADFTARSQRLVNVRFVAEVLQLGENNYLGKWTAHRDDEMCGQVAGRFTTRELASDWAKKRCEEEADKLQEQVNVTLRN